MCLHYVCGWSTLSYTVLICLYFQERCLWRKCFLAKSVLKPVYETIVSTEAFIYLWKAVGGNALRPTAGLLLWPLTSLLSSEPGKRPGVSVRRGSEGSSHVLTCVSGAYDDRHGHRSRLCWVTAQVNYQGAGLPKRYSYPIPSTRRRELHGLNTKSLTQNPFRCICNEKEATRTMLAHSGVSPKHSLQMALIQMEGLWIYHF